MKNCFVYGFCLMTVFSLWSCSSDELLEDNSVDVENVSSESVGKAFEMSQELINSFKAKITRDGFSSEIDYPDYFGGCFIEKDGTLKVLVKGEVDNYIDFLSSKIGLNGVSYEECMYSRNELMDLKKKIGDYIVNNVNSVVAKNVDFVSFSCKKNRIVVGLKNCSDANVSLFRSTVLDAAPLEFVLSDTKNVEQEDVASGQEIYSGGYGASIGYKANYRGSTGFVTAAHLVGAGDNVYLGSNHSKMIATCDVAMHQGTVDAAFCRMNSGWYMKLGIYGDSFTRINPYEGNTVEGAWVKKYGYNGYSDGIVVDESYDSWVGNVYMMDLARTTYASTGGDSGGLILDQKTNYVLGIHQSGNNGAGNYCKVGNINGMLGITLATW